MMSRHQIWLRRFLTSCIMITAKGNAIESMLANARPCFVGPTMIWRPCSKVGWMFVGDGATVAIGCSSWPPSS